MPRVHFIDPASQFAGIHLRGQVNGDDIVASFEAVYGSPDWGLDFDLLWELSDVTSLIFDDDHLARFAQAVRILMPRMGHGHTAVVVRREDDFVLAKLLCALSEKRSERSYGVFHELGEALEWLAGPISVAVAALEVQRDWEA